MLKNNIKLLISLIGMLLIGVAGGWTINLAVSSPENVIETKIEPEVDSSLTLSENQLDSPIEVSENGEKKVVDTVTVDEVDGGELPLEFDGKTNEELNLGRGAYYDASTPESWLDSTYGKCIDLDGYFGSQCVDYFAAYTVQECGFWPSTNGTGAAYGIWDAREYNAHDGCFRLIYDKYNLKVGAYTDFYGGLYGHIGVFLGYVDDNHILLAAENQGGPACEGGGAAVNVITISLDQFRGAFMPTKWDFPEDEPEPAATADNISGEIIYSPGMTFGQTVLDYGYATSHGLWGKDGDVAYYNYQLLAQGLVMEADGRIYGNIPIDSVVVLERREN